MKVVTFRSIIILCPYPVFDTNQLDSQLMLLFLIRIEKVLREGELVNQFFLMLIGWLVVKSRAISFPPSRER